MVANRAQRVREIYRELRKSAAATVPARELLRCAAELVELFDEDTDSSRFELRTGGIPFENQALDIAFADGGWRVLYYETSRRDDALREEAQELLVHNGWARWARELAE
jgi:hypothetical protein